MEARTKLFEELDAYEEETLELERVKHARLRTEVEKGIHKKKDSLTMEEFDARSAAWVEKQLEGKEGRHRELAAKNLWKKEMKLRRETIDRREIMREMEVEKKKKKEEKMEQEETVPLEVI